MRLRSLSCALSSALGLAVFATVVPVSVAQEQGRSDELAAIAAARSWANTLARSLIQNERRPEVGARLALQPLSPGSFVGLNGRQRRQLYEWMLQALGEVPHRYQLVDRARLVDIYRILEGGADPNSHKKYLQVLRDAETRINVVCQGTPAGKSMSVNCSAIDIRDDVTVGNASTSFKDDWLKKPIALDYAVSFIAKEVALHVGASAKLSTIRIVDGQGRSDTDLSRHIANSLEHWYYQHLRTLPNRRPIAPGAGDTDYRLEGDILVVGRRPTLAVKIFFGDKRVSSFQEYVTRDSLKSLGLAVGSLSPGATGSSNVLPPLGECGTASEIAATKLLNGLTLGDWRILAGDRLKRKDYVRLLVEAKAHVRDYCGWEEAAEVLEQAVSGLTAKLERDLANNPRNVLSRIVTTLQLTGPSPALLRLKASAHGLLGELPEQVEAYRAWLSSAPQSHPERRDILLALQDVHDRMSLVAAEDALALGGRLRRLIREGLAYSGFETDPGSGFFEAKFRKVLRVWQESNGMAATGYITKEEVRHLVAAAREATLDLTNEKRVLVERGLLSLNLDAGVVDGQFDLNFRTGLRSWQASSGAEATGYLMPAHAEVLIATGSRAVQEEHEERERRIAPAREASLKLTSAEKVRVQRGLASLDSDVGTIDEQFGPRTRNALASWQKEAGYASTGYLTRAQEDTLLTKGREAAESRFSRLLGRRFSETARDEMGWTDLHSAAALDLPEVVAALIELGMDTDTRLERHEKKFSSGLKETLAGFGHGGKFRGWPSGRASGQTSLMIAAVVNAYAAAMELIERGADVTAKDEGGASVLHYAALRDSREVAELLVDRGANVNEHAYDVQSVIFSANGLTPLHWAAQHGATEVARVLLDRGADIDVAEPVGWTALHKASMAGNRAVAELLLDRGADINAEDSAKDTPLTFSIVDSEMTAMLVERGAEITFKYAITAGDRGLAQTQIDKGADVNMRFPSGGTLLHHIAVWGPVDMISFLVEKGAKINAVANGETPLGRAVRIKNQATAAVLRRLGGQ